MKATGIVRRIDDLGRVVIPKEIRRVLKIREGDPLEIFVENDGEVIFKKYSQIAEIERSGTLLCEAVQKYSGFATALCDKSEIRFIAGESKKDFVGKPLSAALQRAIEKRQGYIPADGEDLTPNAKKQHKPLFDYGDAQAAAVYPIVAEGLIAGALLAVDSGDRPFEEVDKKLLAAGALFLSKQMEL